MGVYLLFCVKTLSTELRLINDVEQFCGQLLKLLPWSNYVLTFVCMSFDLYFCMIVLIC